MDRWMRISNTSWAYATANDLFAGQPELKTPQEYWEDMNERQQAESDYWAEQHIARNYGDCGAPITGTQYGYEVEQDELRAAWGLPAAWCA